MSKKRAGWKRYEAIMESGGVEAVCLVVSVIAILIGVLVLQGSALASSKWEGKPQEVIDAELVNVISKNDRHSPSGYSYAGEYKWYYRSSTTTFADDDWYDYESQVPKTIPVHIYLEIREWHLMGPRGEGVAGSTLSAVGGFVLVIGGTVLFVVMSLRLVGLAVEVISERRIVRRLGERGAVTDGTGGNATDGMTDGVPQADADARMATCARGLCQSFARSVEHRRFRMGRRILRGLGISDPSEVLLVHDDSVGKSGREGFAITESGIRCREARRKEVAITGWEQLAHANSVSVVGHSLVWAGGIPLAIYTDSGDYGDFGRIRRLIEELQDKARELYGAGTE